MTAILGTWNPSRWPWDDLADEIEATASGHTVSGTWSVARRKHGIEAGDRFFLLKQGVEPRGIIASGVIACAPYEDDHWNGEPGATTNYVEVEFDTILGLDEVLPVEQLAERLTHTSWRPQSSGTTVNPLDEEALEDLWTEHLKGL